LVLDFRRRNLEKAIDGRRSNRVKAQADIGELDMHQSIKVHEMITRNGKCSQ